MHRIELTSKDLLVEVTVDTARWPRKLARAQAHEALTTLAESIKLAIEKAPHVGIARDLINVSPVDYNVGDDREQPDERPTAPRVQDTANWLLALVSALKGVKLPEGIILTPGSSMVGDQETGLHLTNTAQGACIAALEEVSPPEGYRAIAATLLLTHELDAGDVAARVEACIVAIQRQGEERDLGLPVAEGEEE